MPLSPCTIRHRIGAFVVPPAAAAAAAAEESRAMKMLHSPVGRIKDGTYMTNQNLIAFYFPWSGERADQTTVGGIGPGRAGYGFFSATAAAYIVYFNDGRTGR